MPKTQYLNKNRKCKSKKLFKNINKNDNILSKTSLTTTRIMSVTLQTIIIIFFENDLFSGFTVITVTAQIKVV